MANLTKGTDPIYLLDMRAELNMKSLLPALVLLVATGCMQLPAEVAVEMSAPDGQRPNHYAVSEQQGRADARPAVESP